MSPKKRLMQQLSQFLTGFNFPSSVRRTIHAHDRARDGKGLSEFPWVVETGPLLPGNKTGPELGRKTCILCDDIDQPIGKACVDANQIFLINAPIWVCAETGHWRAGYVEIISTAGIEKSHEFSASQSLDARQHPYKKWARSLSKSAHFARAGREERTDGA